MVTRLASSLCVASATSSIAVSKAASFAWEGFEYPLTLRTYWSAADRISSGDAGGSKLWSVLMFRHMGATLAVASLAGESDHPIGS